MENVAKEVEREHQGIDIATYAVAVITAISCSLPVKCLFSLVSFALSFCPDVGDGGV